MSDLDEKEQKHVRTALFHLRRQMGGWVPLAAALGFSVQTTVERVANQRDGRKASAGMAVRVARLLNMSLEDLLAGRCLPGACPRCGYLPDFADETTIVEEVPRPALGGGLSLVR